MKKIFLLLASAALLIVGCNKELVQSSPEDAETVDVSFSAALDNTERLTRAVADNDGNAAKVNHWVMEVRDAHNDLFIRQEKDADEGVLEQTFSFKLFKNQTYSIQFWADTKGAYVTEDLTAISAVGSVANVDSRDAFSANVEGYKSEKSEAKSITLYRPFGQLNIITTDLADMKAQVVASTYAKFAPADLKVVASIPTTFNVKTQQAGSATEQTLTAAASYADFLAGAAKTTLFMDYIFASKDENDIVNFAFSFLSDGNEIAYDFTSIPMRRNYRTNIMGQLLSNDSQWTVTIAPAWDGEINPEYVVEGSVAAAIKAIKEGKTVIEISSPADWTTPIALPAEVDGKDISINVTGVSDKELTFLPAEGAQGPANLYITTDVNEQDLVINCPNTHVELNGGSYETVTATTSANTLVIGKDVSVKSLDIRAGNVEIHGKVDELKREKGIKAEMYASDRATLVNYINWAKAGDIAGLETDIDLAGENWTPLFGGDQNFEATLDGQGYTISNLKVENYTGAYIGFISHVSGATIKNVTFKDATLTNAESSGGNARGAVIVGWSYACVIDNCHVINSSVTGCQKVAGILGSMSVEGATSLNKVTNCSVDGLTISCNIENDLFQSGALIGYIQLINANPNGILIENNSVKDITFNDDCSDYGNTGYYNGTFIGTIVRKQQVDGQKIVLNNNTISGTNTEVFKTLYSSPYFGWTTNAENYSGAIAPIIIDGVEWTPNYPFKIVGGKGYATLAAALSAATEGQTVQILKAGEYTVETLGTKASVVEATVDGVVFNHTTAATSWVASCQGTTVKNVTWNVGNAHHQYFSNTNLENCTVNGLLCTHTTEKFKDCTFINDEGYNFWVYGNEYTEFDNCTFTCPGKNDGAAGCGSAINCYNEGNQAHTSVLVIKNCTFTAKEASDKYSAIYVKPETAFDIRITNSTCNDKFCTGAISGSKLWNVKDNSNLNTKVTVDDQLFYANGTVLNITTADQLMALASAVNGGKSFEGMTVSLGADIDMTGKAWIPIGNVNDYPGKVFAGVFDGQNYTISNLTCTDNTEGNACAALFGGVYGKIKNVTLSNVNISSKHYAGGIGAYCSSSNMDIENCHVIGGTITSSPEMIGTEYDNGDKAGGIIGYAGEAGKITGCTVEGVTIRAYRDLGGIAGATSATISNCVVKNSSVIQDNTNGYKDSVDTFHEILGRDLGATLTGNTYENVTVKSEN